MVVRRLGELAEGAVGAFLALLGVILGAIARVAYRVQSIVELRTAENAVVFLSMGGFYALAVGGLVDPSGVGPVVYMVERVPIPVLVLLTVVVPTAYVLVEWLAAFDQLRRQPGFDGWTFEQRLYVYLEIGNEVRDRATMVYVPLGPIAAFWTVVLMVRASPLVFVAAAALFVDLLFVLAVNRFMKYRDPARLPPGTMIGT